MTAKKELMPFIKPRTIAILGASRNIFKPNGVPLFMLQNIGFPGKIYPVNPRYDEIAGITCYPDIFYVPDEIDLAIIAVAAEVTLPVLEQCARKGVKGVVVFTSGFAEAGGKGVDLQEEINRVARETGMRVVGPNCVGIINRPEKLWAAFAQPLLYTRSFYPNNFNFISQSGFFGILTYQMAAREGLLFDQFYSVGNEADLGLPHFLEYLADEQNTSSNIIACYIEGIKDKDGPVFKEAVEKALKNNKTITVIKVGQTEAGTRAASSHTAALTGSDRIYDAFFRQKGIIRVPGVEQLIPVLKILAAGKYPRSKRTAIISDSGGGAVILADKCQLYGLDVVSFEPQTEKKLKEILPFFAATKNPVDLTGQIMAEPELFSKSLFIVEKDPNVDNLVLNFGLGPNNATTILNSLKELYPGSEKCIIAICWPFFGDEKKSVEYLDEIRKLGIPVFHELDDCIWALAALVKRMEKVSRYEDPCLPVPGPEQQGAKELFRKYFSQILPPPPDPALSSPVPQKSSFFGNPNKKENRGKVMSEYAMKKILSCYGIPVCTEKMVDSEEEAVITAEELGYPVVLKVVSYDISHKSELGGVRLNLQGEDELRQVYREMSATFEPYREKGSLEGILVQKMMPPALEFIVGIKRDPVFGPVILCGLGGVFVEVMEDVTMRVAPLSRQDAEEMLKELKGYKILVGTRGKNPGDIEAIIDVLLKTSRLALEMEELLEMDINPLLVYPPGQGAVAVDALGVWKEEITSGRRKEDENRALF